MAEKEELAKKNAEEIADNKVDEEIAAKDVDASENFDLRC